MLLREGIWTVPPKTERLPRTEPFSPNVTSPPQTITSPATRESIRTLPRTATTRPETGAETAASRPKTVTLETGVTVASEKARVARIIEARPNGAPAPEPTGSRGEPERAKRARRLQWRIAHGRTARARRARREPWAPRSRTSVPGSRPRRRGVPRPRAPH